MQVRELFAYLLILSILAQPMRQVGILISFKINQDYIVKNLCENREKPELHCNGHCQLFKQLGEIQSPQNSVFQKNILVDFEVYCQNFFTCLISNPKKKQFISKNAYPIFTVNWLKDDLIDAIFHPPQISFS